MSIVSFLKNVEDEVFKKDWCINPFWWWQHQIIETLNYSIVQFQTSQHVKDIIHKGDENKHIYEYDYYALANDEMDDVTIYLSIQNPLMDNADANI